MRNYVPVNNATLAELGQLNLNESDLIRRATRGDASAFHTLVDAHAQHLYAVACKWAKPGADAEDLVQETFLAALQGLRHFEGRSSFRTWLVVILNRQAALWLRRRGIRKTLALPEDGNVAAASNEQSQAEARMDLGSLLEHLNPEFREVLVLREIEGLSYDEIAAALNVPRGTVESRIFRAREQLKAALKGSHSSHE